MASAQLVLRSKGFSPSHWSCQTHQPDGSAGPSYPHVNPCPFAIGGSSYLVRPTLQCLQTPLSTRPQRHVSQSRLAASSAEAATEAPPVAESGIEFIGVHHVGLLVENIDRALEFYMGTLGLHLNKDRPADKLPYKGAWLWVGAEMIHLMELPNPDPIEGRPEHGGRDRHTCVSVVDLKPVKDVLDSKGIRYTMSKSGRPALFCRDPDGNALEVSQLGPQEGSSVKHL